MFIGAMAAAGLALTSAPACPITSAHYALMGYPELTAELVQYKRPPESVLASDVSLHLHSSRSGRDFWFLLDRGSGPVTHLLPTKDPSASDWSGTGFRAQGVDDAQLQYIGMDDGLREAAVDGMPESGSAAPSLVLIPLLPEWLKYQNPQEFVPTAFFKIERCGKP